MPDALVVLDASAEFPELSAERQRTASRYLGTDEPRREGVIINLCADLHYLSIGYYVSLLAEARGQTPIPSVHTLEGLADQAAVFRALREAGADVLEPAEVAERRRRGHLPPDPAAPPLVRELRGELPVYRPAGPEEVAVLLVAMGRTPREGLKRLAARIHQAWPAPLLRALLLKEDGHWRVYGLRLATIGELGAEERAELARVVARPARTPADRAARQRPSLAVLFDESDPYKPSTPETIQHLARIAERRGMRLARLRLEELERLGEHDALFIRALTGPDQPAYAFAARAEALGMPVIDHPRSILRCSNKVFLHEALTRAGLSTPRARIIDRTTPYESLVEALGLPFVVKLPDGSFSTAVFRVEDAASFATHAETLFARSPLLIAQRYVRTRFDWRVGVLGGEALFAARYHMVPGHWQIQQLQRGRPRYGRVEAVRIQDAPPEVIRLAIDGANIIGDGLYGVDLKQLPEGPVIIEVNDNPNLDRGEEDVVEGDVIYERLISWFLDRLPQQSRPNTTASTPAPPPPTPPVPVPLPPVSTATMRGAAPWPTWEVIGLELEYAIVDTNQQVAHLAEPLLGALAGRLTSDVDTNGVGFSNEMFDHVIELKNPGPLRSLARVEENLVRGVQMAAGILSERWGARLLPGGMHPWMRPAEEAHLWRRSGQRIYQTYARLFEVRSHGWANVQSCHVNLPVGSPEDAPRLINAAALLVPYLPALAASSPMMEGQLQDVADGRVHWLLGHQARLPESCARLVPEYTDSLKDYRRDILGTMYRALDRFPDTGHLRHEFLNARGAVLKMSRASMEVRILDVQECPHADVAIACFVRRALRHLARHVAPAERPPHAVLVADLEAVARDGSAAQVAAPHLGGPGTAQQALLFLLERAAARAPREEQVYLALVERMIRAGSLAEAIQRRLRPHVGTEDFATQARGVWDALADGLRTNRLWEGRWV